MPRSIDPEPIAGHDYPHQITQVAFLRLMGVLGPHKGRKCSVVGGNHPSCEQHAKGADYIQPLTREHEEADPSAFERYLMY